MQPQEPYIIDIESSGFGSDSYPIEVGVACHHGERYCTLILPEMDWTHWDCDAENVHHISRQVLEEHGKKIDEVTDKLNELFAGETLYSDGWVVDKPWINTLFYAAKKQMQFEVSPLEMILSEPQMAIWHDTKDRITEELHLDRHRASNDAYIIQETYKRTLALCQQKA